jgi:hypothetical protein
MSLAKKKKSKTRIGSQGSKKARLEANTLYPCKKSPSEISRYLDEIMKITSHVPISSRIISSHRDQSNHPNILLHWYPPPAASGSC